MLTDDAEDANGSATALPLNTIRLYVTAPDDLSTIGDYDDWYTELVTHEYTHIAHTDNISGVPAIVNAVLGKTLAPNQVQPHWILEGLAVVSESEHTSAGRIRSNLFDMYLRADVLDGRIAGLDQFSSDAYRWPQGNLWYLYGSRFLALDHRRSTAPTPCARWRPSTGRPSSPGASTAPSAASPGAPTSSSTRASRTTSSASTREQVRAVEERGLREGTRITRHGRNVYYPRFVPRGARARRRRRGDPLLPRRLRRAPGPLPPAARRAQEGRAPTEELVARADGHHGRDLHARRATCVFNGIVPFKNYYSRNDLFSLPRGETSPSGDESGAPAAHRGAPRVVRRT